MSLLNYLYVEPQSFEAKYEFCHKDKASHARAYKASEKIVLSIALPTSLGATDMFLEAFKADENECFFKTKGINQGRKENKDVFLFEFDLDIGLYYLRPAVISFGKNIYGRKRGDAFIFDGIGEMLQLTVSDFLYEEQKSIRGGIIYHIFVDRFNRGGNVVRNDYNELIEGEWEVIPEFPEYPGAPLKNNTLYGGTLYGIIDKLDYIASLGCNAIYLSPIFESVSNHKYDTADYMKVDPCFGGDEALSALIREAKKKGISIILDGVFNHTGADSIYFNRYGRYETVGAYQSKDSEYYDWFDFKEHPDKYTCWWDIEILPRINPDKPRCRDFFVGEGGVIDKYRKMGVYGFRLDVADELSDDFIGRIKARLNDDGKDSILYGEVWEDASNKIAYDTRKKYYLGAELDGVMNYPLRRGLIDYVVSGDMRSLEYYFNEVVLNTPDRVLHNQMNLLGTHDTERILTILGGKSAAEYTNAELSLLRMTESERELACNRLCALYTVLATLPGVPTIFYGDEVGLEGYGDPFNRMPYPYGKEDLGLLKHFRAVGNLRRDNEVYKKGGFRVIVFTQELLIFERFDDEFSYLTVFNNGKEIVELSFKNEVLSILEKKKIKKTFVFAGSALILKSKRKNEIYY